ncbi:MAG: peptidylprolyl isomerase [Shimia sp.]|uniref:peptidylprolyl isomerase n=1 Tax=Shimia sp. TaxID=1954381 RepID=UPI004058DCB5
MRKLAAVFALMAAPALATEMTIEVEGYANGTITIDLLEDVAPGHVARLKEIADAGRYDGVAFHRVIEGFMAQTGDVQFGNTTKDYDGRRAGTGSSGLPDLKQEFSDINFDRGVVGMARKGNSVDTANSQFFVMFAEGGFLNGQYTVIGSVTEGMDVVDQIKRGHPRSGAIEGKPDVMKKVTVTE